MESSKKKGNNTSSNHSKKPVTSSNSKIEEDEFAFFNGETCEHDKNQIVEVSPKGRFYRFNEELGAGAYKTVYRGLDNDTGCEVAWNVIRLTRLPLKDRKRIAEEISLLKHLNHPNIINFLNAWINKTREEVLFITEIVTGGSLKKYLKKIRAPRLKVVKSWARDILSGLDYLHSQKPAPIIHRDIKCENIFINSNKGEIRIGDLGLATCLKNNSFASSVLGTPEFMAPEIYEEAYSVGVDIYAFGMVMLEMTTLQTPYRECTNPAQIYKKVMNRIKPLCLDLIVNQDLKNFILKCLADVKDRPSAAQLLQDPFLVVNDSEEDNQSIRLLGAPHFLKELHSQADVSSENKKPAQSAYQGKIECHSVRSKNTVSKAASEKNALGEERTVVGDLQLNAENAGRRASVQEEHKTTPQSNDVKKQTSSSEISSERAKDSDRIKNFAEKGITHEENNNLDTSKQHEIQPLDNVPDPPVHQRQRQGQPAPFETQEDLPQQTSPLLEVDETNTPRQVSEMKEPTSPQQKATTTRPFLYCTCDLHQSEASLRDPQLFALKVHLECIFPNRPEPEKVIDFLVEIDRMNMAINYDELKTTIIEQTHVGLEEAQLMINSIYKFLTEHNMGEKRGHETMRTKGDNLSKISSVSHTKSMFLSTNIITQQLRRECFSGSEYLLHENPSGINGENFQPMTVQKIGQVFGQYYDQYISSMPLEMIFNENENAMHLRQETELLELQKIHIIQKDHLLRRQQINGGGVTRASLFSSYYLSQYLSSASNVFNPTTNTSQNQMIDPAALGYTNTNRQTQQTGAFNSQHIEPGSLHLSRVSSAVQVPIPAIVPPKNTEQGTSGLLAVPNPHPLSTLPIVHSENDLIIPDVGAGITPTSFTPVNNPNTIVGRRGPQHCPQNNLKIDVPKNDQAQADPIPVPVSANVPNTISKPVTQTQECHTSTATAKIPSFTPLLTREASGVHSETTRDTSKFNRSHYETPQSATTAPLKGIGTLLGDDKLDREKVRQSKVLDAAAMERVRNYQMKGDFIKRGGSNDENDVILVQFVLNKLLKEEYYIEETGKYGQYTETLLKKIQEQYNLWSDGIVSEAVWRVMKAELEKRWSNMQGSRVEGREREKEKEEEKKKIKDLQNFESAKALSQVENDIVKGLFSQSTI